MPTAIVTYYQRQLYNPCRAPSFLKYKGRWYEILDTKVDIDCLAECIVRDIGSPYYRDVTDTYTIENIRPSFVRRYYIR